MTGTKRGDVASSFPVEVIANRILLVRGHKVLLDADLAALYGVQTRVLNQAVKRNPKRFPSDFMFRLSAKELEAWRSQFVISKPSARMALRRAPYAFTEHGALMAATVLNSGDRRRDEHDSQNSRAAAHHATTPHRVRHILDILEIAVPPLA